MYKHPFQIKSTIIHFGRKTVCRCAEVIVLSNKMKFVFYDYVYDV